MVAALRLRLTGLGGEAGAGALLIAAAVMAMAMANGPWGAAWLALWHHPLPGAGGDLAGWIDAGLMTVFFFTVGLEIKREALAGQLADRAGRRLPVLVALAGMVVPVLVYLVCAGGDAALRAGWAIPAATDIAFALGVLALAGRNAVPGGLRLLLLSVAIVDDLGAVAIIALAYGGPVVAGWLAAAGLVLAGLFVLNRCGVGRLWPYAAGALALWWCVLAAGVQPSLAGVAAAMMVPLRRGAGPGGSPLVRLEHALAPLCGWVVLPLFALANAGVRLAGVGVAGAGVASGAARVGLAVGLGLVLGKVLGLGGALALASRSGWATVPDGATPRQLLGIALLGGIGFTMSLFITALAFPHAPALAEGARIGVLGGSLVAAVLGFGVLVGRGHRAGGGGCPRPGPGPQQA